MCSKEDLHAADICICEQMTMMIVQETTRADDIKMIKYKRRLFALHVRGTPSCCICSRSTQWA